MQKRSTIEILYRGQVPMLMQPVTEKQRAMSVMTDCLEWAKSTAVINPTQYRLIMNRYQMIMRQSFVCHNKHILNDLSPQLTHIRLDKMSMNTFMK